MWEAGLGTVRETHQEEDYVGRQPGVAEAAYTKGLIPTPAFATFSHEPPGPAHPFSAGTERTVKEEQKGRRHWFCPTHL